MDAAAEVAVAVAVEVAIVAAVDVAAEEEAELAAVPPAVAVDLLAVAAMLVIWDAPFGLFYHCVKFH